MRRRQDEETPEQKTEKQRWALLRRLFEQFGDDLFVVVAAAVAALVRAMGVTVESGQTGLLFSFGRARRELKPGFHLLIPFLQTARKIPTRSRTMDLRAQRVATFDGLVYHVEANLVYRVVDVRKALIEIDHLEKGMMQMLGLGVQEVLRGLDHEGLRVSDTLNDALARNLETRLEPWGVIVERAGFTSITPSRQSLRITQLAQVTRERHRMLGRLDEELPQHRSLALIGMRGRPRPKTRALRNEEIRRRRSRRLRRLLMRRGWLGIQVTQALGRLRERSSAAGRLKPAKEETKPKKAAQPAVGP